MLFLNKEPQFAPVKEMIPRDLATPAKGCVWEVPIAIIVYAPTRDGVTVDADITDYRCTVQSLRERVLRMVRLQKWMMEEGSRFRGYRNPAALPSLGYRCVHYTTFLEDIPARAGSGVVFPDYAAIVERVNGRSLVNVQGVKEFWIYHWHHGKIAPIETNLSSPVSPDISNSDRTNDLPIYQKTYMVIGANFNRGPDKTVHNMGHQMEAVLSEVSRLQDGSSYLFDLFVGKDNKGGFRPGRCGNCHFPPNATKDYDYYNHTPVMSDIEDWNPCGNGKKKAISCDTWERLPYRSPTGDTPQGKGTILESDAWWYLYWFQNFPGHNNGIEHPFGEMTNWWRFLGDWDGAIREKYGLWKPKNTPLQPGEIALYGRIVQVSGSTYTMRVQGILSPDGRYEGIEARNKEFVMLSKDTVLVIAGRQVRVIGKKESAGKPMSVRNLASLP